MAGRRDDSGFGGMIVTFGGMNVISGGMVMISGGLTMTKWRDECDFRRDELIPHFESGTPDVYLTVFRASITPRRICLNSSSSCQLSYLFCIVMVFR